MEIFAVFWVESGAGEYLPPDPIYGEATRTDLHNVDLVTTSSAKKAKEAVSRARPLAKIKRIEVVSE